MLNHKNNNDKTSCPGCVCHVLRNLKDTPFSCNDNNEQLFTLVKKNGIKIPNLRFVRFNPDTCCATFRTFTGSTVQVWDCKKLTGIICQNVPPIPPQPPVDCTCNGTITAGQSGTPETFANNRVTFIVPSSDRRNVNGRVNICEDCTIEGSVFEFMVPSQFQFTSNVVTSAVCSMNNMVLTVTGVGTATPRGGPMGDLKLDGVFSYELVLTDDNMEGSIEITLRDTNGVVVFQTAPFTPSVGGGKSVSITECT
ncbi:hypothetical protein KUV80_13205 [Fictibacillus nanhaiensis]|uniref:hypothetical protein n=1 Tax=Fictibacillus nanhaiensis TaxID=742169 RepID=UPI001C96586C|nr:hypothetical protein [Fictibacillus nanhaiensis]MBY6037621.1 hypothetical protein [Fictibacillus nanhaiensis]